MAPAVCYLDLTLPTLAENLALDEALLLQRESKSGLDVLRIWEWQKPAVIVGAAGILGQDVNEAACQADGVPILRRASGGGTVLLGPGCLLYSVILSYDRTPALRHIGPSYCHLLRLLCQALDLPGITCAGVSDLALNSLKVSGNSQQRKRDHLLHHGTLLYAFDVSQVSRYLCMPERQPEYRQQRPHGEFLTNLPIACEEIVRRLRQAFGADEEIADWPAEMVRQLVADKYELATWTHRR